MESTPESRIRPVNAAPVRDGGDYVLYWMIAARRSTWNFGLQRAIEHARAVRKPLVVLEALRCDYRWASDRLHRFVLDGMRDNRAALEGSVATYYPYVEPRPGAGRGLLEALARRANVVVTDDFPAFMLPSMVAAAGRRLDVRLEAVDGNGLLPMAAAPQDYPTAYAFRRFLHKSLPEHLVHPPSENPLRRVKLPRLAGIPEETAARWPPPDPSLLGGDPAGLSGLPIDHEVRPVSYRGGSETATDTLETFLDDRLARYADDRNQPEQEVTSGLSPYLHFGHVSVHEILFKLAAREGWTPSRLAPKPTGRRQGWWGMSRSAEAFMDELVTWRELGYVFCRHRPDYDRFSSLPDWARQTLVEHASDPRAHLYDRSELEGARTHDPLWNAAQRQLVREGRIHNYLRMLWGKKILEWTRSPEEALDVMVELNNRYAVDGRNPNSYSGIFWVLGRFDRPWGPIRPVFGTIRYMSSENTARKFSVKGYMETYGDESVPRPFS